MRAHQRRALNAASEALAGPPAPFSLGPSRWIAGDGAWEAGADLLKAWPGPLGLLGEGDLLRRFRAPLTGAWLERGLEVRLLPLDNGSDCCPSALADVLARARALGLGSLAALGGGRALDLGKLASAELVLPLATLPTSAATCACATAVAVRNDGSGGYTEVVDLPGPPDLCLVELAVLRAAPPRLLAAGLADTYAKWLEWRAVADFSDARAFGAGAGLALAEAAARVCEERGAEALKRPASGDFEAVLEACLLSSAAASCVGRAPAAAAHSLANALSRQGPGRALLHGEAVGLGLLWQEALLARSGRANMGVEPLRRRLQDWGLPVGLPSGLDSRRLASDAWAEGESAHLLGLDDEAGSPVEPLFGGS